MKKIIKATFKALSIGLAAIVFSVTTAETAYAGTAAPAVETVSENNGAADGGSSNSKVVGGVVGGTVGAATGAAAGAAIGGIGVVMCGTGFGIPVGVVCIGLAVVCGGAGTGIGSFIGSFF